MTDFQKDICAGIPDVLPPKKAYDKDINHAPKRKDILSKEEKRLALKNALRYFPAHLHAELAPEFAEELETYGRIYMYRLRPDYEMYARPIDEYPCRSKQAAAIMLMINNNLDKAVAQHPHELITYGGNGAVFQMNAGRKQLKPGETDLRGKLFVSSGLGGMSGAQPKAGVISGVVSVIAEINPKAAEKRHAQGWVDEIHKDLDELIPRIRKACADKEVVSLAYEGNIVDLWERLVEEDIHVDLGSDQTSLHNPWAGGYYPVGYSYEESNRMMAEEPERFHEAVRASLRRQIAAINKLADKGMYFFDYGNAFLLESSRAGADVMRPGDRCSSTMDLVPSVGYVPPASRKIWPLPTA